MKNNLSDSMKASSATKPMPKPKGGKKGGGGVKKMAPMPPMGGNAGMPAPSMGDTDEMV